VEGGIRKVEMGLRSEHRINVKLLQFNFKNRNFGGQNI